jgi:hypothetical protein
MRPPDVVQEKLAQLAVLKGGDSMNRVVTGHSALNVLVFGEVYALKVKEHTFTDSYFTLGAYATH